MSNLETLTTLNTQDKYKEKKQHELVKAPVMKSRVSVPSAILMEKYPHINKKE
jgi:hypothetical protein